MLGNHVNNVLDMRLKCELDSELKIESRVELKSLTRLFCCLEKIRRSSSRKSAESMLLPSQACFLNHWDARVGARLAWLIETLRQHFCTSREVSAASQQRVWAGRLLSHSFPIDQSQG